MAVIEFNVDELFAGRISPLKFFCWLLATVEAALAVVLIFGDVGDRAENVLAMTMGGAFLIVAILIGILLWVKPSHLEAKIEQTAATTEEMRKQLAEGGLDDIVRDIVEEAFIQRVSQFDQGEDEDES